jgi:hypothetical protein
VNQIVNLLVTPSFYAGMGCGFMISALVAAFYEGKRDGSDT